MRFSKIYEKLGWTIFTTVRLNTGRYKIGNTYTINLPDGAFFKARVIGSLPIKKKDITDELACVDAETDREGLIKMLDDWYGKYTDDYVLITFWSQ